MCSGRQVVVHEGIYLSAMFVLESISVTLKSLTRADELKDWPVLVTGEHMSKPT